MMEIQAPREAATLQGNAQLSKLKKYFSFSFFGVILSSSTDPFESGSEAKVTFAKKWRCKDEKFVLSCLISHRRTPLSLSSPEAEK